MIFHLASYLCLLSGSQIFAHPPPKHLPISASTFSLTKTKNVHYRTAPALGAVARGLPMTAATGPQTNIGNTQSASQTHTSQHPYATSTSGLLTGAAASSFFASDLSARDAHGVDFPTSYTYNTILPSSATLVPLTGSDSSIYQSLLAVMGNVYGSTGSGGPGSSTMSTQTTSSGSTTSSTSATSSTSTSSVASITPSTSSSPSPSSTPASSPAPTPTLIVHLSNDTVTLGDEDGKNNGTDLRNAMFSGLQAQCPFNGPQGQCNPDKGAEHIDHIGSLSPFDQPDYGNLNFTVTDSGYNSERERDQMLAAAVAAWEQAAAKTCKSIEYTGQPYPAALQQCNNGPVKRDSPMTAKVLDRRDPKRVNPCTFHADLCAGPDHINLELENATDPYANYMDISIAWVLETVSPDKFDKFACELIIGALTAAITAAAPEVAPELAEVDIFEGIEVEARCEDEDVPTR